jgi:uncharacterized iron-regulated protein
MNTPRIVLQYSLLLALLVSCFYPGFAPANAEQQPIRYQLAISFDIQKNLLVGTAHLTIPAGQSLTIFPDEIQTTAILLQKGVSAPASLSVEKISQLTIPSGKDQQELYISYEKEVVRHRDNSIEKEGIALLHNWYPLPSRDVLFTLSAQVPQGFVAISESDHPAVVTDAINQFTFSTPTRSLHFIAAPFIIDSLTVRDGLPVYTYFLPEDRHLAKEYLTAARDYILRYEKLIGPYPYNHFAIVENVQPTGFAMPTFTLLGKSVIRLPFIKFTSLGHEILHSWFGNSIEAENLTGNWTEGLTSYLADWLYREDNGEGPLHRKENILKYLGYVTEDKEISLESFGSASHRQPMAEALRSVGYIRGAMVFHELRNYIGDYDFFQGIQLFYSRYRGKTAGWADIESVFETVSGVVLDSFFEERLERPYIPDMKIADISTEFNAAGPTLGFTLQQTTPEPFVFALAIGVETSSGLQTFTRKVSSTSERIHLQLSSPPLQLIIDPEYNLLRHLDESERVALWSDFLGPKKAIAVVPPQENEWFSVFLDFFAEKNWEVKDFDQISADELKESNFILPGKDNRLGISLFGSLDHPPDGLTLQSRIHPLNTGKSILLINADAAALKKSLRKLQHYGKYSYLHFRDGTMIEKQFSPGNMGIRFEVMAQPVALPSADTLDLNDILKAVQQARVIYVGESHTAMADHHLQYLIIEGLHRNNPDIVIGMEMFPRSSRQALDQYIGGDGTMNERDFLKSSGYFKVWKYDYRYYKPIIDFAKNHAIPLVGLNIDRDIVGSIFKEGWVNTLTEEEMALLPRERDLSLPGYSRRLRLFHDLHRMEGHGGGDLSGFIQAQAVWDEVMGESIAEYLKDNPEKKMIVLAGKQHVRKDNGIPPRLKRRLDIKQSILMRQSNDSLPTADEADYYFFMPEQSLPAAGTIGISIAEKEDNGDSFLEIAGLVEQSNAAEAGLRKGDRLEAVNGYPVETMEDVRIAMMGAIPGDPAVIMIKRPSERREMESHEIKVVLHRPADSVHSQKQ